MNTYKHLPEYLSNGRRLYSSFLSEQQTLNGVVGQATHDGLPRHLASRYSNSQYRCLALLSSTTHRTSAVRQGLTAYAAELFLIAHQ